MLVNGSRATTLPLDNRGLSYGDGLFETIRIHKCRLLFLEAHLDRLARGLDILGIQHCIPEVREDITSIAADLPEAGVLKLLVTRGAGGRGYRPDENAGADRIITLHSLPSPPADVMAGVRAFVCRFRLQQDSLAGIKHLNRLEQVMASREWPGPDFQEGLMLDSTQRVVEGTKSNVFIASSGRLLTPPLRDCGIAGVLRGELLKSLPGVLVTDISREQLEQADEIFFCNSVVGVWPVREVMTESGELLRYTPGDWCDQASEYFQTALDTIE